MKHKVKDIFTPGVELSYQYDFGSTTELSIKAVDNYHGITNGNQEIQIVTRNAQPLILCDECGENQLSKYVASASGMKKAGFVKSVLKTMDAMSRCFCPWSTRPGPEFVAIPATGNGRTACRCR